jgi:hypothetical protein
LRSALSFKKAISIGLAESGIPRPPRAMAARTAAGMWAGDCPARRCRQVSVLGHHLFDIGQEGGTIQRPVEQHRRRHAIEPEPAHDRRRLPVTVRDRRLATRAAPQATIEPRYLGRCARLVDEDEAPRIDIRLGGTPGAPLAHHVRTFLLAGVRGFFEVKA